LLAACDPNDVTTGEPSAGVNAKPPASSDASQESPAADAASIATDPDAPPTFPDAPASAPAPPTATEGPRTWWSPSWDSSGCIDAGSPAERIKSLRDIGEEPKTFEHTTMGTEGDTTSVMVEVPDGDDFRDWTYYRDRAECESVAAQKRGDAPELQ
jgi:hypothetical protein